jgi:hypothetical protein
MSPNGHIKGMLCDKTPTEQPDKTLSSSNKNEPLGNALTHTSSHASAYNLRWSGFIRKLGHIPATSRRMITPWRVALAVAARKNTAGWRKSYSAKLT